MNSSDYTNLRGYLGCTPQPCMYNSACCTGPTGAQGPTGPGGSMSISGQGTGSVLLNSPPGSANVTYSNLLKVTNPTTVEVGADLLPAANNVFSLGSLTRRWKEVIFGPGSAKAAEDDGSTAVIGLSTAGFTFGQADADGTPANTTLNGLTADPKFSGKLSFGGGKVRVEANDENKPGLKTMLTFGEDGVESLSQTDIAGGKQLVGSDGKITTELNDAEGNEKKVTEGPLGVAWQYSADLITSIVSLGKEGNGVDIDFQKNAEGVDLQLKPKKATDTVTATVENAAATINQADFQTDAALTVGKAGNGSWGVSAASGGRVAVAAYDADGNSDDAMIEFASSTAGNSATVGTNAAGDLKLGSNGVTGITVSEIAGLAKATVSGSLDVTGPVNAADGVSLNGTATLGADSAGNLVTTNLVSGQAAAVTTAPASNFMVAVGDAATSPSGSTIAYSEDGGQTWKTEGVTGAWTDLGTAGLGVAYNGSLWIAVGIDDNTGTQSVRYSTDGKAWSTDGVTNAFTWFGSRIAWGDGKWIMVGRNSNNDNKTIKYSTNGKMWIDVMNAFTTQGINIAYSDSTSSVKWIALGQNNPKDTNTIKWSNNGIDWSNATGSTFSDQGKAIVWDGARWRASGANNPLDTDTFKWSDDGITWYKAERPGLELGCASIAWNGSTKTFLALNFEGQGDNHLYKSDVNTNTNDKVGIIWSTLSIKPTPSTLYGKTIVWNGIYWVAAAKYSDTWAISYSTDGDNWTGATTVGQIFDTAFDIATQIVLPNLSGGVVNPTSMTNADTPIVLAGTKADNPADVKLATNVLFDPVKNNLEVPNIVTQNTKTNEIHTLEHSIYFDNTSGDNLYNLSVEGSDSLGYTMICNSATGSNAGVAICSQNGVRGSIYTNGGIPPFGLQWQELGFNSPGMSWTSVANSANGNVIIAANSNQQLNISLDFGKSFAYYTPQVTKVACSADGQTLVAGSDTKIYVSTDVGTTWNDITPPGYTNNTLYLAVSPDGNYIVAAQVNGSVFISSNKGTSWIPQTVGTKQYTGVAVSQNASKIIVTTQTEYLYISSDKGTTFTQITSSISQFGLKGPSISADGSRMLVASDPNVFKSTDGGVTWSIVSITAPIPRNFAFTSMSSTGQYMAAAILLNNIYTSTDYGTTWSQQTLTAEWSSICVSGSGNAIVASQNMTGTSMAQSINGSMILTSTNIILDAASGVGTIRLNASQTLPGSPGQYSLGSSTYTWKDIYVGSNSKVTEAYTLSDGTANIQLSTQSLLSFTGSVNATPQSLVVNTPGSGATKYLRVEVNGTIYRIQMIAE